jgi:hypothetical protein
MRQAAMARLMLRRITRSARQSLSTWLDLTLPGSVLFAPWYDAEITLFELDIFALPNFDGAVASMRGSPTLPIGFPRTGVANREHQLQ